MGGRYGESDDGNSDYQDRRPDEDDRSAEQLTIAAAVQAVADQQQPAEENSRGQTETDDTSGDHKGQHPFTTLRPGTSNTGRATLQEVDQQIAEYVADQLTGTVEQAVEEVDPDDDP